MLTPEPLHIAFVWHMHQPYYRSARTGVFSMPWARMHALKDYLDMVEILADYPELHQTFNLVPSLVEQLEDYASGHFTDIYWEHTLKPAGDLDPTERAFVVERMCEHPDHPRARLHDRYLELARKREAHASHSWEACAEAFTVDELRDLQIWFNLAWFDPLALAVEPLAELVKQGRGFSEDHKQVLAQVQTDMLVRTLPTYREAAVRGQAELSTSPYFHPILPLLINSDCARISAPDTLLPSRRFAHRQDAAEQVSSALDKHESVFGKRPQGMWCSEQAVGEDVLPILINAGLQWTISDETVLARSLSGAAAPATAANGAYTPQRMEPNGLSPDSLYSSYRLERHEGELAIVFRDHTLSDLIGFAYQSWDSRHAAADLLQRLRDLRVTLASAPCPLVTIALDGENAWEYYPGDGRDFLRFLYEGLNEDPSLRCVTIEEHLRECPPVRSLGWLHTGSWIGGDLRTWSGDKAHNTAWDLLHDARDAAAASGSSAAWRHILIAEGSDWFWWFGDHRRSDLDHVWDLEFRVRLQEVYRLLQRPLPTALLIPILDQAPAALPSLPRGPVSPVIDGRVGEAAEWEAAGLLAADLPSTMQRSEQTQIDEVRFGWQAETLCVMIVPASPANLEGLEVELRVVRQGSDDDPVVRLALKEGGRVEVSRVRWACSSEKHAPETPLERTPGGIPAQERVRAAWADVLEVSVALEPSAATGRNLSLVVHVGRDGMIEHVFHSVGLTSIAGEAL